MMRLVEAAHLAHIPPSTLRGWVYSQRLTATKRGKTLYVDWTEVEQLAEWRHARRRVLAERKTRRYDSQESGAMSPTAPPSTSTR